MPKSRLAGTTGRKHVDLESFLPVRIFSVLLLYLIRDRGDPRAHWAHLVTTALKVQQETM